MENILKSVEKLEKELQSLKEKVLEQMNSQSVLAFGSPFMCDPYVLPEPEPDCVMRREYCDY
jgi:hypothetical protein